MTQLSAYVFSMHVFGIYFHPAFFFLYMRHTKMLKKTGGLRIAL